jgi:hypothetical protein
MFLRRVILSFLEAYAIMVAHIHEHAADGPRSRDDLVDEVLKQGRANHLRGEVLFLESLAKPTMLNVVRLLEEWGAIVKESSTKKETIIRVSETWLEDGRLEQLAQRLEALVYIERSNKTETLRLGS